jgi:hypothetical protein
MIGDRWGVTDAEVARHYPCDDLVPDPVFAAWRGVTVAAAPDQVWPWITQIRLAPYSYDWLDNGGRRSPQELRQLADPVPGEPFTATVGRPIGRVLSVEAGRHYTGSIAGVLISYVLEPAGDGTRLLMKLTGRRGGLFAQLLSVGDLVMARRQLLNIKRLAESATTATSAG